ncbi:D-ala-D-ala transporter subunit; membrane component of ABC superfamily [Rhizobium mesoamericanum STM3625]|uniref:D-ala-D-ala transporter subunit membrane component of ABC superfamily n=2 Tax=Rhizobium mesoamericanum TaxID=1079800 RepID=K0Q0U1_9HYPH|nr:D-ala-D-ala transporter subunit; membrane component of ABC superfamily [Rhizobium mesoamericanum STM3625]
MEARPKQGRAVPIAKAVGRFLVAAVTTYLGLLAVTFFIGRVVPIDPVLAILGDRAPAHVVERVRRELGFDLPLYQQFYIYLKSILSGDFGTSVLTTNPVMVDIRRVFPATIELATLGTIIGSVIGVPLGVLAAVRRGSITDQLVRVIGLIGYSVPIFWLALISLVIFYAQLRWVAFPGRIDIVFEYSFTPVTGFYLIDSAMQGQWDVFYDVFRHIILPASLLGYFSLAYISRMTRSFMLNELSQEYVVAARAKGLSETRVIWGHALRNAAVPLVTVIALSYAGLLEGSVLTETVFSWPGIGLYITNSLQNADMNAVLGGTIVIGTVFIGINLLSDLLYRTLDPRTRSR